jgi:hypothetical protein
MTSRNFVICEVRGIIICLSPIYDIGLYCIFQLNTSEIRRGLTAQQIKENQGSLIKS